ncbi:MAG TPA: Ig-like domain repeat protein [Thermoleophilaceae bacterium]
MGLALACLAWGPGVASGGTYDVLACDVAPGGARGSWTAKADAKMLTGEHCPTAGGEAAGLFAGSGVNVGTIPLFANSQQYFEAPPGTSLVYFGARYMFRRFDPYWMVGLFVGDNQMLHGCQPATQETGCNFKTSTDATWGWSPGQVGRIYTMTACLGTSGCRSDAAAPSGDRAGVRLYAATVRVHDDSAPAVWDTGAEGLTNGAWQRGTRSIGYAGSDNVGFRRTRLWVDGNQLRDDARDCDFTRRRPCDDITYSSYSVNTAGLSDGRHELRVEGVDAAGNSGSHVTSFSSDNTAPDEPRDVKLEGGEGWRQTNQFKLTWRNPPSASPISIVHYELCNVATKACTNGGRAGGGINSINDLSVPEPGHYTLRLVLQDEAGNVGANKSDPISLRFDNVPPGEAEPQRLNGWLNAEEANAYEQLIRHSEAAAPVSGIVGYSITQDGSTPDGSLDVHGSSVRLALPEGTTTFRARAISGAGVASAVVGSTQLRVDRSPPSVRAENPPDPESWHRESVDLALVGTDQEHLSGMAPAAAHLPVEVGAFIAYRHDSGGYQSVRGANAMVRFEGDGKQNVTFRATDVAGNNSPEKTVTFKIDRTAPELVVFEAQDDADPRRVVVAASDRTSGIANGVIEMRRMNGDASDRWIELPATRDGERFAASVDDESVERGVYQLRARVTDRAGNETTGDRRRDGSMATVDTATLRAGSRLTAGLVTRSQTKTKKVCSKKRPGKKRKCRKKKVKTPGGASAQSVTIPFARGAVARGSLEADNGSPLDDAVVDVYSQSAAAGSEFERLAAVRTDPKGAFSYTIPAGTSRAVRFRYAGSSRHRSSEHVVTVKVAASTTIAVTPKRVRNGQTVGFRGKLRSQPIPAAGKVLDLQAYYRGRWRTFATPRARANGKWSYRYRFGATRGTVPYRFRVLIRPESAYPYDLGYSKTVSVVVRGR